MSGTTWPLRLGVASLWVGEVVFFWEGVKRAGTQRERDGGGSFLATTDSIRQQHRTAFCALKNTRSNYKPAIYDVDSGLSFDASSFRRCLGERIWPLRLERAGPGEQGGTSSIRSFWSLETSFHAFIWMLCSFIMFLVFDTHATLSDGK